MPDQDLPSDDNVLDIVKPHDRRAFLTRAGAGAAVGGLVWVAPSILTIDAAAAASCGVGVHTLNWNSFGLGAGPGVYNTGAGATAVAVTVGTATSGTNPASSGGTGSLGNNWTIINAQIGGSTAVGGVFPQSWYMQMTASANGLFLETTFHFNKPVVGLSFSLFDIDIQVAGNSGGNPNKWTDLVTVTATNGATAQNVNVTKPAGGTTTLAGSGTTSASALGTANATQAQNTGNATFTIPTAVTDVIVKFSAQNTPTNPIQYVSIGNLTWNSCA